MKITKLICLICVIFFAIIELGSTPAPPNTRSPSEILPLLPPLSLVSIEDIPVIARQLNRIIEKACEKLKDGPQEYRVSTPHKHYWHYAELIKHDPESNENIATNELLALLNSDTCPIFFMDINVPGQVDGLYAARCIRKTIPSVFLSKADALQECERRASFAYLVAVTTEKDLPSGLFDEVTGKINSHQEILEILHRASSRLNNLIIALNKNPDERSDDDKRIIISYGL